MAIITNYQKLQTEKLKELVKKVFWSEIPVPDYDMKTEINPGDPKYYSRREWYLKKLEFEMYKRKKSA